MNMEIICLCFHRTDVAVVSLVFCRFALNFVVGFSRDIAFHLNPRIREGLVIRNSRIGGMWGQEEIELGINPFMEGQYFDVNTLYTVHME